MWPRLLPNCVRQDKNEAESKQLKRQVAQTEASEEITMLKQWLSQLETVHRAESREEREAIYRFRYRIYFEEFGRELGSPDHARQWVKDDDDDKDTSTLLYTGTIDNMTGTVRLRHWMAGAVPEYDVHELSMDLLPGIESRNTGEIGRLMVRRSMRGKVVLSSLLRASYEIFAGEQLTDLVFCYCSPGLVRLYQQLAMRPFGGRLVNAPDGMMVPLVSVLSDRGYYRRMRSFLAPLVRRFFGPGKRPILSLEPYLRLFAEGANGIEFDPDRVWRRVEAELLSDAPGRPGRPGRPETIFDALPREAARKLASSGQILDVNDGTLVTRKGFGERELYIVLDGCFEAIDNGRTLRCMQHGDLFGEIAFLDPEARRTASVVARGEGRVLVLRGRAVDKLMHRDQNLGVCLRDLLAGLMTQRLGTSRAVEMTAA